MYLMDLIDVLYLNWLQIKCQNLFLILKHGSFVFSLLFVIALSSFQVWVNVPASSVIPDKESQENK